MALRIVTSTAAGGWLSATTSAAVLFPISMPIARCAVPLFVAFVMLGLAWKLRAWWSLLAAPIGALLGMVVMFAQRAPLPSTHPRGGELAQVVGFIVLALAETGPGRGFDSVGHAAGTYRNRVRIEPLPWRTLSRWCTAFGPADRRPRPWPGGNTHPRSASAPTHQRPIAGGLRDRA